MPGVLDEHAEDSMYSVPVHDDAVRSRKLSDLGVMLLRVNATWRDRRKVLGVPCEVLYANEEEWRLGRAESLCTAMPFCIDYAGFRLADGGKIEIEDPSGEGLKL